MEIEKAIDVLKTHNEKCSGCDKLCEDLCKPAVGMAIKALENQIAKKPQKREVGSEKLKRIIYHCPNCGKRLYDCAFKNGELDHVSPGSRKKTSVAKSAIED